MTSGSMQGSDNMSHVSFQNGSIGDFNTNNYKCSGYFNSDGYMTCGSIRTDYSGTIGWIDYTNSNDLYIAGNYNYLGICGYADSLCGVRLCGTPYALYNGYMSPVEVTICGQTYQAIVFISGSGQ
jgi:hypothetical protein